MAEKLEAFSLDPHGNEFVIRKTDLSGNTASLVLTEDDVLILAQSALRLRDKIHERHTPKAAEAGVGVGTFDPVAKFRIDLNLYKTDILLTLIDGRGFESPFAVPLAAAKALSDRLAAKAAEMEIAAAKKSVQ